MKFSTFSQHLQKLEETSSRLDMTAQLADLFQKLESDEIPLACYLMLGQLVPTYQSLEFNMSEKLTIRALARLLSEVSPDKSLPDENLFQEKDNSLYRQKIEQKFKELGDLGVAIEQLLVGVNNSGSDLSIPSVHQELVKIAQEEGDGSQERKINQTYELLLQLNSTSAKYVVRVIVGKLRLGFSTMTIIDALSWVQHQDKSDRKKIEQAYNKKADIGRLTRGYLQCHGQKEIDNFLQSYEVEVGIPVVPALCQRLNSSQEIIEKMGEVFAEPKYDGLRAQIHIDKSKEQAYQVFTRNLDDVTYMFPELDEALKYVKAKRCVLDAEAIAYDKDSGKLLPFQQTITRKRKHGISNQSEQIPIRFYAFDCLLKDEKSLVNTPLTKRKQVLAQLFESNDILQATDYIQTSDPIQLHSYHEQQLALDLEGAVMKKIDAPYRGGRKGWRWVKIKETEGSQGKLADTLDCIVMGYYRGQGKRAAFGIGAFLVGVLAGENQIKTIAKIGTGLTDEQFKQIKQMADEHQTNKKPNQYQVPDDLIPDVWVNPDIVVEIAADELTNSPIHTAGQALRFPRLVEFRQDKDWEQATTIDELSHIG